MKTKNARWNMKTFLKIIVEMIKEKRMIRSNLCATWNQVMHLSTQEILPSQNILNFILCVQNLDLRYKEQSAGTNRNLLFVNMVPYGLFSLENKYKLIVSHMLLTVKNCKEYCLEDDQRKSSLLKFIHCINFRSLEV